MDLFMGELNGRLRVSVADSTMMWIVHEAMHKAHEKVKAKGVISRLNEISKFYELAVIQLEGCLRFVQEEADSGALETPHQDLLTDLAEIRNHLQGRLVESEMAILEKDAELAERLESEIRLRHALHMKEMELASLRSEAELQRGSRIGGAEDSSSGNVWGSGGEESRGGEFCELKISVDQQVWNIKQKLDSDYNNQVVDEAKERTHRSSSNTMIERMGSDIDTLKETLDLAFGKMQIAISSSEMGPMEQEWRWGIEKDINIVLIKEFIRGIQEHCELADSRRVAKRAPSTVFGEDWSGLMHEIALLRYELGSLISQSDVNFVGEARGGEPLFTKTKSESSIPKEATELLGNAPSKIGNEGCERKQRQGYDGEDEESHLVARMIKSHESIIQQRREELNWLKSDIFLRKGCSSNWKEKDPSGSNRRIEEVIWRLDEILKRNSKLSERISGYCGGACEEENYQETMSDKVETYADSQGTGARAGLVKQGDRSRVPCEADSMRSDEIRSVREEKELIDLQSILVDEIYITLLKSMQNECHAELFDYELDFLIRQGILCDLVKEATLEQSEEIARNKIESWVREELYSTFLLESTKYQRCAYCLKMAIYDDRDVRDKVMFPGNPATPIPGNYNLQDQMNDVVHAVVLREILKERHDAVEDFVNEILVTEEIGHIVSGEIIKDMVEGANSRSNRHGELYRIEDGLYETADQSAEYSSLECALKENVFMVFLRETTKEWREKIDACVIERSISEKEMHQFVVAQSLRHACDHSRQAESQKRVTVVSPEGLDVDEEFATTTSTHFEKQNEINIPQESSINEENGFAPERVQRVLNDSEYSFRAEGRGIQEAQVQETLNMGTVNDQKPSMVEPKETGSMQFVPSHLVSQPLQDFSEAISDLQRKSHDRLGKNIKSLDAYTLSLFKVASRTTRSLFPWITRDYKRMLELLSSEIMYVLLYRLHDMKSQLHASFELVDSLRRREMLYRKAFIRRCQNLQKAETEVDLLGDQVEALLELLEMIYAKLRQSPVFEKHFEISEILGLIKKELINRNDQSA
ncbi:uncharacterized protein LOC115755026 [Rhodamnia argentea]|uniref:Uncharacterized protein LOC115755026 n=1 Tax=Rhodamnia argentea TaxID=178133 RepID=A0ABM3HEF6_9MYRT|nr:uncharacterized protein LOC115755026 [Rhodamnia argentea]